MPSVFIKTYGCQMNERDSEAVAAQLVAKGYSLAPSEDAADVVLLNTCSVRDMAERKAIGKMTTLAGLARKRKPDQILGFMGCMAQSRGQELIDRLPDVDLVIGTQKFHRAADYIDDLFAGRRDKIVDVAGEAKSEAKIREHILNGNGSGPGVTAFVSIMQGCNQYCTFCIVPYTRGEERSRTIDDIVSECRELVARGVREITLLGQTVNAYGRDLTGQNATLAGLLRALHEIPSLRRLAFITSHPNFLSPDLATAMAELPKVARYLHLPAQSGSNTVLKAMRRGYTVERYLARVEQLLAKAPDVELHSDFIVGYPGETTADFDATVALVQRIGFAQSYVFKYSPRPGTVAAELPDDVPDAEKERRNAVLLEAQEGITLAKNRALVGSTVEVLVEGDSKVDGRLSGRTTHHRLVHFATNDRSLIGQYVPVRVTEALAHSVVGELLPHDAAQAGSHDPAETHA